jgi:hypothetical protein
VKLLVFGGRDFNDRKAVFDALDRVDKKRTIYLIIEDGEPGPGALAREWAAERGASYIVFGLLKEDRRRVADGDSRAWPAHRNDLLLMCAPDGAVAFPGDDEGTADMMRQCLGRGVKVWEPLAAKAEAQ